MDLKLKVDNYFTWSPKMELHLTALGLVEAIEEQDDSSGESPQEAPHEVKESNIKTVKDTDDEAEDDDASDAPQVVKKVMVVKKVEVIAGEDTALLLAKRTMNRKCCATIIGSIEESLQYDYLGSKDALDLWKRLKTKFATATGPAQR